MSQPYSKVMAMRTTVTYIPYATSSREQTVNINTFTHFEEGGLLSETRGYTEIGNKYDDGSTPAPLISEEEIDTISSGDESDAEPKSTDILEDIRYGSQSHPSINRIYVRYKIHDCIKLGQIEWKGALLSM